MYVSSVKCSGVGDVEEDGGYISVLGFCKVSWGEAGGC